jgi:hypothetical protein
MRNTRILVTIDVEGSMGGYLNNAGDARPVLEERIFCVRNNKEYGIGMIMDILEQYAIQGVFFIDAELRHYFNRSDMSRIVTAIKERGHEIALHCHPIFGYFKDRSHKDKKDKFFNYTLNQQKEIIGEAKKFLIECGAGDIFAFRASSFSANEDTHKALKETGIKFSSSYNISSRDECKIVDFDNLHNAPFWIDGIIEFPITCIRENILVRSGYKPLQLCAISSTEMSKAIDFYVSQNISCITILMHSFEFITHRGRYHDFNPNQAEIKKLKSLCSHISKINKKAQSTTFRRLEEDEDFNWLIKSPDMPVYRSKAVDVCSRYISKALSR